MSIRQFDVCRVTGQKPGAAVELAVVLQHDISSDLTTRVVAPLIKVDQRYRIAQGTVEVDVQGAAYVMAPHLMGTVPVRNLQVIGTIANREAAIKNAVDFLFFGI